MGINKLVFLLLFISTSAFGFRTFSDSALRSCSLAKTHEDTFKICLRGNASRPDFERAKLWAELSTVAWFRVFKTIDRDLTTDIEFTCTNQHLTINLLNGSGRSYATTAQTWIYNEVAYGTWTHELGHALVGLGDTYSGSQAGNCQRGQPQSLMCWGGYGPRRDHSVYSTLWDDDVNGAKYTFDRVHGETIPSDVPDDYDLLAAFDLLTPYPESFSFEPLFSNSHVEIDEDGGLTPINPFAEFD